MAMKPIAFELATGDVNVRAKVPRNLWALLVRVGHTQAAMLSIRKFSDERAGMAGLTKLLTYLGEACETGDIDFLPIEFQKELKAIAGTNFGATPLDGASIDVSTLHRSTKLKSGYVGVYTSGQGSRAMSRDAGGKQIVIGTFKTPEEAAFRRQRYHRQNNLAYGELETEMDTWRNDSAKYGCVGYSDQQLIAEIKKHAKLVGTYDQIFGPGSCTIEPVFSKLPTRDAVIARAAESSSTPTKIPGFEPGDAPPEWDVGDILGIE